MRFKTLWQQAAAAIGAVALVFSTTGVALEKTFLWDNVAQCSVSNAPGCWPIGTTVELCSNGLCIPGLDGTTIPTAQYRMDIPVDYGGVIDAKARAVTPEGYQCGSPPIPCPYSEWTTLVLTYPPQPSGLTYTLEEKSEMAAPTFVAEYPTAFNNSTTPKTAMSEVAINSGDVLVEVSANESSQNGLRYLAVTENGTASFVLQQNYIINQYTEVEANTYTATTGENLTVTIMNGSGGFFGGNVIRFSGSAGVGASAKAQSSSGSPSVNITTTQANSAIVAICGDWNAVSGTQTFTLDGSSTGWTALTDYPGDGAHYGVAIGYIGDAGAAGTKTIAMSAPTGQKWSIIVVEVKGSASASASLPPVLSNRFAHLLVR